MIRDIMSLVTRLPVISVPLPTMIARVMLSYPRQFRGGGITSGSAEAGRPRPRFRDRRHLAPPPPGGGEGGGGLLLPQGVHPRLNPRGRRVPPGARAVPKSGLRARGRLQGPAGDERPVPGIPRASLSDGGGPRGEDPLGLRRALAPDRPRHTGRAVAGLARRPLPLRRAGRGGSRGRRRAPRVPGCPGHCGRWRRLSTS